jgi:hypothetical protein
MSDNTLLLLDATLAGFTPQQRALVTELLRAAVDEERKRTAAFDLLREKLYMAAVNCAASAALRDAADAWDPRERVVTDWLRQRADDLEPKLANEARGASQEKKTGLAT